MQQTITIIDAIHIGGLLHAITRKTDRKVRVEIRMRDRKALLKARPNNAGPSQAKVPTLLHVETTVVQPPVQGEVMGGADNQGAGQQGRPVRQNMYRGYRPRFRSAPPRQRQPREDGNEEDKENQGGETHGQQPPPRQYRRNFNYPRRRPENPKPQDGKKTKAADPSAEN